MSNIDFPDVQFGDKALPDWREDDLDENDDDDDEEIETPRDVIAMLGFDPAKEDELAEEDYAQDVTKPINPYIPPIKVTNKNSNFEKWMNAVDLIVSRQGKTSAISSQQYRDWYNQGKPASSIAGLVIRKQSVNSDCDYAQDSLPLALDEVSVRTIDADGRMHVAVTNISKAVVNPYLGSEIPDYQKLGLDPNKIYKLLRDPKELEKAAPSFNSIQLLMRHIPVSADDPQKWDTVGTTGSDAVFEAPYLKNSIAVWDKRAIDLINSEEARELSCAYRYVPVMESGVYEGIHYDGRMTALVGNHVAVVREGRAGEDVTVADGIDGLQWSRIERALTDGKW